MAPMSRDHEPNQATVDFCAAVEEVTAELERRRPSSVRDIQPIEPGDPLHSTVVAFEKHFPAGWLPRSGKRLWQRLLIASRELRIDDFEDRLIDFRDWLRTLLPSTEPEPAMIGTEANNFSNPDLPDDCSRLVEAEGVALSLLHDIENLKSLARRGVGLPQSHSREPLGNDFTRWFDEVRTKLPSARPLLAPSLDAVVEAREGKPVHYTCRVEPSAVAMVIKLAESAFSMLEHSGGAIKYAPAMLCEQLEMMFDDDPSQLRVALQQEFASARQRQRIRNGLVTRPIPIQGRAPEVSQPSGAIHNADFTLVDWFGERYRFSIGVQSSAVRALWQEWEKNGLGLHQATIGEQVDAERDNFRIDQVFRNHPAFGTMIQALGDGCYALVAPGSKSIPATKVSKKEPRNPRKIPSKSPQKRR